MIELNWEWLENKPLSYSSLCQFRKSPRHYLYYLEKPYEPPTEAMKLGLLAEHLLISGKSHEDKFIVLPSIDRRTNKGKEDYANFVQAATEQKKELISDEMLKTANLMVESARANPYVATLLSGIKKTQKRLLWKEKVEYNGKEFTIPMVGYVDFESVTHLGHVSGEIKTAQSADFDKFSRDITNSLYYLQPAIYRRGWMKTSFQFPKMKWIVMETNEPYCVNVIDYPDRDIEQAQAEFYGLLTMYAKCMEENRWQEGYMFWKDNVPYTYYLPKWIKSPIAVYKDDVL